MDVTFLTNFINPIILGICLLVGYTIKTAVPKIPNRFIPLGALILGTVIAVVTNIHNITLEVILGGMFSGLASTGLYEMVRNLIGEGTSVPTDTNVESE